MAPNQPSRDDDSMLLFLSEEMLPQRQDRFSNENDLAAFDSEAESSAGSRELTPPPGGAVRNAFDDFLSDASATAWWAPARLALARTARHVQTAIPSLVDSGWGGVRRFLLPVRWALPRSAWSRGPALTLVVVLLALLSGERSVRQLEPRPALADVQKAVPIVRDVPLQAPSTNAVAAKVGVPTPSVSSSQPLRLAHETMPVPVARLRVEEPQRMPPRVDGIVAPSLPRAEAPGSSSPAADAQFRERAAAVDGTSRAELPTIPLPTSDELTRLPERRELNARPLDPVTVETASIPSADADAVRQTLRRYESAYERLDVAATATIWPSVDRRALTRAFATIKSQGLTFETCDIEVAASNATARCHGLLQVVPKVGSSTPFSAQQEWRFRMQKADAEWKIENVTASRSASTPR